MQAAWEAHGLLEEVLYTGITAIGCIRRDGEEWLCTYRRSSDAKWIGLPPRPTRTSAKLAVRSALRTDRLPSRRRT